MFCTQKPQAAAEGDRYEARGRERFHRFASFESLQANPIRKGFPVSSFGLRVPIAVDVLEFPKYRYTEFDLSGMVIIMAIIEA